MYNVLLKAGDKKDKRCVGMMKRRTVVAGLGGLKGLCGGAFFFLLYGFTGEGGREGRVGWGGKHQPAKAYPQPAGEEDLRGRGRV